MKKIGIASFFIFHFSFFIHCSAQNISTVAGHYIYGAGYSGNGGPAMLAELNQPTCVTLDKIGNLYIVDEINNVVRKVDYYTGIITTVIGSFQGGYSGDGGQATSAELNYPYGIAIDKSGNFYVTDAINYVVRKVNYSTGIITTVTGNHAAGYSGDGGPATSAELHDPTNSAIDDSGNIFIADYTNNVIRKVNRLTGIINTVAGHYIGGYYGGDGGPATAAGLWGPMGVAIDKLGNMYIADDGNNAVRKVDHITNIITTVAGNGFPAGGYTGDGGQATSAELNQPANVCFDSLDNMFISDSYNYVIRKVDRSTGIITTIAGNGYNAGIGPGGYSGDGGPATNSELAFPSCVAFNQIGNMFIADSYNNVIRRISVPAGISEISLSNYQVNIYPNPSTGIFNISLSNVNEECNVEIFNIIGERVYKSKINSSKTEINLNGQPTGIYLYRVQKEDGDFVGSGKIMIEK